MPVTKEEVMEALKKVRDPELGIDVVNLGLIYEVNVEGSKVDVKMSLTTPYCPAAASLPAGAREVIQQVEGVEEANVEIVWQPPWNPDMMSDEAKEMLGYL